MWIQLESLLSQVKKCARLIWKEREDKRGSKRSVVYSEYRCRKTGEKFITELSKKISVNWIEQFILNGT
jgi:hypothetical protein